MLAKIAASSGQILASDGLLMLLSLSFGIIVGLLWLGRLLPRRAPRAASRSDAGRRGI